MPRMAGKHALLEMLKAEGVEYIFGNPGTTETPIMDALQDHKELKYIVGLQENPAVGMADGYARASGKPSFCNLHVAGGLAGGITMLYDAYKGGTPMVLSAGQADTRALLTEPGLSGDLVQMVEQYTKWAGEIQHAADIPQAMRRAFKEAKTPPTGPVFLSLPWNVMDEEAEVEIVGSSPGYYRVRPDVNAVAHATRLLLEAEDPIMLIGDRISQSGAVAEAVRVAELTGAQVLAVGFSEVNFPTSHPQYMGMFQRATPAIMERLRNADVVLGVGANLLAAGLIYVPDAPSQLNPRAKIIHMDNNLWELEKIYPTEVPMLADPKAGLQDLADSLEQEMTGSAKEAAATRAAALAERKRQVKEAWEKRVRDTWDHSPMTAGRMMAEVVQAIPKETIICGEAVTSGGALLNAKDYDEPGSYFGLRGGALGWGMPGPIGVKLANPDRLVVAAVGDGSSMYTIQSLWTAHRYNVPVTYLIFNNSTYRILKQNMDIYLRDLIKDTTRKSEYVAMDFGERLQVAKVAEGMGVHGETIDDPADLQPALKRALASGEPALLDVTIDATL